MESRKTRQSCHILRSFPTDRHPRRRHRKRLCRLRFRPRSAPPGRGSWPSSSGQSQSMRTITVRCGVPELGWGSINKRVPLVGNLFVQFVLGCAHLAIQQGGKRLRGIVLCKPCYNSIKNYLTSFNLHKLTSKIRTKGQGIKPPVRNRFNPRILLFPKITFEMKL